MTPPVSELEVVPLSIPVRLMLDVNVSIPDGLELLVSLLSVVLDGDDLGENEINAEFDTLPVPLE